MKINPLFQNQYKAQNRPSPCTIGSSGICCHVLALLLFLQHFAENGEKLLELTVTQQLQTWHKKRRKGSIPMVPLAQIKIKSHRGWQEIFCFLKMLSCSGQSRSNIFGF